VAGTSMTHPALFDELLQRHLINSILEFSTTTRPTPSEPHATMFLLDLKTKYPVGSWLRAVESPGRTSSDYSSQRPACLPADAAPPYIRGPHNTQVQHFQTRHRCADGWNNILSTFANIRRGLEILGRLHSVIKDKNDCKSCGSSRTERLFPDQFVIHHDSHSQIFHIPHHYTTHFTTLLTSY